MFSDWKIFAIGAAFFAALTAIFGKIGVTEINSHLATFVRTLIVLLMTATVLTFNGQWQRPEPLSSKSILFLFLSGIATGLSWLCYYRALQLGPVSKVAPVDKLSVVLVIIFSTIFLNEALTWKVGLGGILVAAGAILLIL